MLKKIINGTLGLFGKEIRSVYAPLQSFEKGLSELAKQLEVDWVVDVGVAQGTPELYRAFAGKRLLLVEANPVFQKNVEELAQKFGAKFEMVFCGAEKGSVALRIPDNGRSASMYVRESAAAETVSVPVDTLDAIAGRNGVGGKILLKIDVEGAELEVLRGAPKMLAAAEAVVMEVALARPGHEGPGAEEKIAFMKNNGFVLYNIVEGGGILEHQRLVQADFIFIRG